MSSLIKRARVEGLWATMVFVLACCAEKKTITQQGFYNIDSLVTAQVEKLKGLQLNKSVEIDDKQEQSQLTPDSIQWANEFEIFRQLQQINKPTFRDAYVVSDTRDTNSNLTIREIKAQRDVPISVVKLYYLRTPNDIRKVEATFVEENALYTNTRKMLMEMVRVNNTNIIHRYRVESIQKFMVSDSVRFVIAGEIAM